MQRFKPQNCLVSMSSGWWVALGAVGTALLASACTGAPSADPSVARATPPIATREVVEGPIGPVVFSYCTGEHYCEIATSDVDGSSFRLHTRNEFWALRPSWSPSGEWIAFQRDGGEDQGIYVMRASGGRLQRVASSTDERQAFYPCWVDEGRVGFSYGKFFATATLDDRRIERHRVARTADCEPGGKTIAFVQRVRKQVGKAELIVDRVVVGDIEGTSHTVLAEAQLEFSEPSFSPDGNQVAFCAHELAYLTGSWVGVARSDGTGRWRRLRSMSCEAVSWTPDGEKLIVDPCSRECITLVDVLTGRARKLTVGRDAQTVDWRR